MKNLQNYATELDNAQNQERKARGSHYISRVENPIGVCDTLWIPVTTSNRSASVNLNHTVNGFDTEGRLWGENGNCCTPYQIIELPDSLFNPSERNGSDVDCQKEMAFLTDLGNRLIKKLNKTYTDPLLAIKADGRMPVIIETIKEMVNEN
jgi:hypothetical protein